MAVLGGFGGHFVGLEAVLSIRDPTDKKTLLAVTWRQRGFWGIFLADRNGVRTAQLSNSDDVGWCVGFFPAIRDLLVFLGLGKFR